MHRMRFERLEKWVRRKKFEVLGWPKDRISQHKSIFPQPVKTPERYFGQQRLWKGSHRLHIRALLLWECPARVGSP